MTRSTEDSPTAAISPTEAAPKPELMDDPRRWRALGVLALAQFMVVLDITIANVALPAIQDHLHFSTVNLQWVISAYSLTFGGLLLLGGRTADLLGRRSMLSVGLALFGVASLGAGFSSNSGTLIAFRALQGIGAALLSPAALSIITVTFAQGKERAAAMTVWASLGGLGGTAGVVLGGVLVQDIGWEWVFWVNVPIVAITLIAIPKTITNSRVIQESRSFDILGAVLGTVGVSSIVLGVIRSNTKGWSSAEVVSELVGGLLVLVVFGFAESHASQPLIPPRLVRSRHLVFSSLALALSAGSFIGTFFLSAIWLQEVRGASAIKAGLEFVPMGVTAVLGAVIAQNLVSRVRPQIVIGLGAVLGAGALVLLAQANSDSSYATAVLPGFLLFGASLSITQVPAQVGAMTDVKANDAGAASGFLSTAFQVGAAIGLAVISTFSNKHTTSLLHQGIASATAHTDGWARGLYIAAGLALVNVIVALILAGGHKPATNPESLEVLV
jgi:EmrB/QacA subfamily drug resistance transporter